MKDLVGFSRGKVYFLITLFTMFLPSTGYAVLTDVEIQEKLTRPYEQNANELMTLVVQEEFEEVETFLSYVVTHDLVTRDGTRYLRALLGYWFYKLERVAPFPVEILPYLHKWVDTYQNSALAYIIRGTFYIDYAWEARGTGWAKDVGQGAWENFYERMTHAQEDLVKAYELNPQNPHSYRQLMRIAMSGSNSQEILEALFQQAITATPTFYWAYRGKLNGLMPKWGGTWKLMFAFARETEANAPPETLLPLILIHAHEEAAARSGKIQAYYSDPAVWNDIERIYTRIIEDFPDSGRWKTDYADIAYDAGKIELAKQYWLLAAESDAQYVGAYERVAWLYEEEERWELEEKYARQLVELYPQYVKGHGLLGYALGQQRKYQEAVESYTSAIKLDPLTPLYWSNRCYYYNWLAEFEKAIHDCTKAIELNDDYAFAYQQRKYAYEQSGENQEAEADQKMYEKLTQN